MFTRVCFVAVSAMMAVASAIVTAQPPQLPAGSKVFIASMDGFDKYFRAATKDVEFPLVFVKTRAEAVYEVTGSTKEVPAGAEVANGDLRTSQRDTTIKVSNIDSGETVFTHSITTTVNWPSHGAKADPANRNPTPSRILAIGKETAARQCAKALRNAINVKPVS
jgi:hypothetical protein